MENNQSQEAESQNERESRSRNAVPYFCDNCGVEEDNREHRICFHCMTQLIYLRGLAQVIRDRFNITWEDDWISVIKRGLNALVDKINKRT